MNTFKTFRAALMATALFAFASSTAAFGQLQVPATPNPEIPVKNAVAFQMGCYSNNNCNATNFTVPKGYRLVVTQISASIGTPAAFVLAGTLNGQTVLHVFPIPVLTSFSNHSVASHNCFLVWDSISASDSYLLNGIGTIHVGGYLVKM